MPLSRRRGASDELNPWPGYVDALSTLLMVIIFVLLVFVLAQAFLSVALTGRDRALDRLNRQVAELTDMLSLERGRSGELQLSAAALNRDLQAANAARDQLTRELADLRGQQARGQAERDALQADRDRLSAQLADAQLQSQSAQARNEQLQSRIAETAGRSDAAGQEAAAIATQLAETRRALTRSRADLEAAQAELERTVRADKATIEARLADIAKLNDQVRALTALRDELEGQVREAAARATTAEQQRQAVAAQLADEQKLGESARAQLALLNQQVEQLRARLQQIAAALEVSERTNRDQTAQIDNLTGRLNAALASKVEELQHYRSEFFGRLREVLQNRPDIQVVGDRFVFQSEVLFPVGSADLTPAGQDQIKTLAATLKQIAAEIPSDIKWVLRVDGHADRQRLAGGQFATNWELSAQRAINVVKLLVQEGVPANRLAATGFGEFQPLDSAETPQAYARNRRIELRLTDR
jgi:chemotaxis protein MotB